MKKKNQFALSYDPTELFATFNLSNINLDIFEGKRATKPARRKNTDKFVKSRYIQLEAGDNPLTSDENYFHQQRRNLLGEYRF